MPQTLDHELSVIATIRSGMERHARSPHRRCLDARCHQTTRRSLRRLVFCPARQASEAGQERRARSRRRCINLQAQTASFCITLGSLCGPNLAAPGTATFRALSRRVGHPVCADCISRRRGGRCWRVVRGAPWSTCIRESSGWAIDCKDAKSSLRVETPDAPTRVVSGAGLGFWTGSHPAVPPLLQRLGGTTPASYREGTCARARG